MIGTTISHYRIVEHLGGGGMGMVYRAEDLKLARTVALKFLPPEWSQERDARERFMREARAASALDHPNICTVHDIDETEDGRLFIAMTFYEGETLKKKIERGPLPIDETVGAAIQIAEGLRRAHEAGIVHRDIKPANVIVTERGEVKIVDFGLAKMVSAEVEDVDPAESPTATGLTGAGAMVGTAGYMSPEQVRGRPADARSDIFSLGVVLYEMLTGTRPFAGDTVAETAAAILRDDPPPLAKRLPDALQALETIVAHCLEKRPEDRFQSAGDLVVALRAVSRTSSESEPGVTRVGAIRSIAVLPFEVAGGDEEVEYLADGLTEGITGKLCGLPGIDRVIARHSVARYSGQTTDPATVGRELQVDSVLVGELALRGDEVRISAELVAASQGDRIWGDCYIRRLTDLIGVEDAISKAVADGLRLELSEADRARIVKRRTEHSEAYRQYLKGRHLWNRRTREALERSIELYREAIALDQQFALAYTGIADSWVSLAWNDFLPRRTAFREALSASLTALEIDDQVAESHVSLGMVLSYLGTDWGRAEKEYRRAAEITRSCAETFHQHAHLLSFTGRTDAAIESMLRALDLDPVSRIFNSCFGQVLYFARQYEDAVAHLEAAMELDPANAGPLSWLGMVHIQQREYARAEEALAKGLEAESFVSRNTGALGYCYGVQGKRELALGQREQLSELASESFVDPCFEAWVHAGIGDSDGALAALERAYDHDANWLVALKVDPFFDDLRSEPRFQKLLRLMNLAEG
jgi:serine/threonine-protein kinase